jgi:hypothetical protein
VSRNLTAGEVRLTLANMARLAPDDIDGYVIVLAKDADVLAVMSNAADESTMIALLARAIEHRSRAVGALEDTIRA